MPQRLTYKLEWLQENGQEAGTGTVYHPALAHPKVDPERAGGTMRNVFLQNG